MAAFYAIIAHKPSLISGLRPGQGFTRLTQPFPETVNAMIPTIVLDLDDVLANLRESLYRVLAANTGIDRHWRDWPHYDLCQHFGIEKPELEALLIREQALEACEPEPDAAAATAALAAFGFELTIITARAWHPSADTLTRDWLERHEIRYHDLRVVALGGNKLDALPEGEVLLAVDDHPSNIRRYQQAGIPSLMMHMPWNVDHAAERIHDLDAVVVRARNLLES